MAELGWDARSITISHHPFSYFVGVKNPAWAALVCDAAKLAATKKSRLIKIVIYLFTLVLRAFGALWVAASFRVVVLNAGRSLLPLHLDLILYRLLGIRVIAMLGHGSEARPPCIDSLGEELTIEQASELSQSCKSRKRFVRRAEALSSLVISTPTIGHYLTRPFVNSNDFGIPIRSPSTEELLQVSEESKHRTAFKLLRVVHAPSNPKVKGSEKIIHALTKLDLEGLIEFELIQGLPNSEVIRALRRSDLLVDQLYSDLPLPVLASEAAFLAVPTMIGSLDWGGVRKHFRNDQWSPAVYIHPDELEKELRKLIPKVNELKEIGRKARMFVKAMKSPGVVALSYEKIILGDFLSQSEIRLFHPKQITYRAGCGSSQRAIDESRNIVHGGGKPCWI